MLLYNQCARFDLDSVPPVFLTGFEETYGVDLRKLQAQCRKGSRIMATIMIIIFVATLFVWKFAFHESSSAKILLLAVLFSILFWTVSRLFSARGFAEKYMNLFIYSWENVLELLGGWNFSFGIDELNHPALAKFVRKHMSHLEAEIGVIEGVQKKYAKSLTDPDTPSGRLHTEYGRVDEILFQFGLDVRALENRYDMDVMVPERPNAGRLRRSTQ